MPTLVKRLLELISINQMTDVGYSVTYVPQEGDELLTELARVARMGTDHWRTIAMERQMVIDQLNSICKERQELMDRLNAECSQRQAIIEQLDLECRRQQQAAGSANTGSNLLPGSN